MLPQFPAVGVVDLLESDPRPAFIVALSTAPEGAPSPAAVYSNPALAAFPTLLDITSSPREKHGRLWDWITSSHGPASSASLSHLNVWWTRTLLMQKWVVVAANEQAPSAEPPRKARLDSREPSLGINGGMLASALPHHDGRRTQPLPRKPSEAVAPDLRGSAADRGWILPDFMDDQEPFLNIINSVSWDTTPLGHMGRWPPRLQQTFNQILADSRPIAIYWGSAYTTIYNEAFSKLCGSKHPWLLGRPVDAAWPEAGRRLKETMTTSAQKQRASIEDEWRFFVEKTLEGPEETYLKWSIIPIMEGGQCLGFMHPVLETTSMRLWERRMKMLIDLGDVLVTARDVKSYWGKTVEELGAVEPRYDIPLVILYSVQDDPDAASEHSGSHDSSKICRLEGSLGVPKGHPISPETLVLRRSDGGLASMFREALRVRYPVLLQTKDGSLPEPLLRGLQWRGFGDPCSAAVICPIRPTKDENVMGLLLLGLNPRRPYDNDYRQYISLLSQKLTTSLASTVLLEEEARRGRNAAEQAAYDQEILKERLAVQTQEATESIRKFEAVAQFIPVGMCFGDWQGNITFANDAWYRITGYPHNPGGFVAPDGFLSCVVDEDKPNIVRAYDDLKHSRTVTFEFRVKTRESPLPTRGSPSFEKAGLDLVGIDDAPLERHVLASAKPERAQDGSIIRVLTCLTDVTLHKRTAEEAVRRAQQAENLKRMAEFATVGMYDMDLDGRLLGANNVFYEMSGLAKVDLAKVVVRPWQECVAEEDLDLLRQSISRLASEARSQTAEIRLRTQWEADDGAGHKTVGPRWVEATFMPVRSSEGVIQTFTGCLTDISLRKYQLASERERKEEAIESKRQQENFIDMTSHEMRNPLSAIVHCADAVIASLTRVQELGDGQDATREDPAGPDAAQAKAARAEQGRLVGDSIDSAETIVACALHQRIIVDDILTMSKLDSKLLVVTPTTVRPIQIVQEALKMFEVEARRVDIDLSMAVDPSYRSLGVDFVDFDPSRLKQVLINLLTNALKFTKAGPTRNVAVTLSASKTRPTDATSSVQFIPRSEESCDEAYPQPNLVGRADPIFLLFEVKDTGQGLTEKEKKSLFQRFVQASSRTHVKYGGSGLGLFITRRLTELQNGAIGVASLPGVGSTFAFYIESYQPTEEALREAEATASATRSAITSLGNMRPVGNGVPGRPGLGSAAAEAPLGGPKITGVLVVEDNLINQQITRRGLTDRGFTVDVANHGVEALEKLTRSDRYPSGTFPLSLILMDIEMPIQNGLTCTRHIRELERQGKLLGGRIPIIAVSANAREEQVREAKAAGCDDVLVKPYRMPELIEKMHVVAQRVRERGAVTPA